MLQELKSGRRSLEMFYFLFKTAFHLRKWRDCMLLWGVMLKLGHVAVRVLLSVEVPAAHRSLFLGFLTPLCTRVKVQPQQVQKWHGGAGWEMLVQGSVNNLVYHLICSCMDQVKWLLCVPGHVSAVQESKSKERGWERGQNFLPAAMAYVCCGWVHGGMQPEKDR